MARTTWRYAVTLQRTDFEYLYEIHEVYTGPDGTLSWPDHPAVPFGNTYRELADDLARMQAALTTTATARVLDITDPEHPEWRSFEARRGGP